MIFSHCQSFRDSLSLTEEAVLRHLTNKIKVVLALLEVQIVYQSFPFGGGEGYPLIETRVGKTTVAW